MSDPKIEAVQRIYAAYARQDLDAVLAEVTDDVDWAAEAAGSGSPWYGEHRGKDGVARFFAEIGESVEVHDFVPESYAANDSDVMVQVNWSYNARATGKPAAMRMQHLWRFHDGKVSYFRGSEDSAQTVAAFTPSAADVVRRYYAAFNARAIAAYDELFTADAILEAPDTTGKGVAAMREFDQTFTNAASEFRIVTLNTVESGSIVTSENVAEAVHDGPFVTPAGTVPPTGNVLGGKYVGVFEVRDGKIAAQRIYYDRMLVAAQLGLLPDGE